MAESKTFVFCFPIIPGHINPSLAVARQVIAKGHKVHYICRDIMKPAIEAVGATFHSDVDVYKTMLEGREFDAMGFGVSPSLAKEHGFEDLGFFRNTAVCEYMHVDLKLTDLVPFLQGLKADAVVYCPMINGEGGWAANFIGIPSYSITTVAGPGSLPISYNALMQAEGFHLEAFLEWSGNNQLITDAMNKANEKWKCNVPRPPMLGKLEVLKVSKNFVTTIDEFMEPCTPELVEYYAANGSTWMGVGPLFDEAGATRAVAMKEVAEDKEHAANPDDTLKKVQLAKKAGRPVIVVSLGTMITGDTDLGWNARQKGEDGKPRGLTGKQVCQSAWGGVFDSAGKSRDHVGPLIVVSIGAQPDALGDLEVPANAICQQNIPQVDILKESPDLFVFGGGQNGFMEALSNGVPLLCLPALADQFVTAAKVPAMGVGISVDRPFPDEGAEADAVAKYRTEIAAKLDEVLNTESLRAKALSIKTNFSGAGGIPQVLKEMGI